jgi:hypothetical protein
MGCPGGLIRITPDHYTHCFSLHRVPFETLIMTDRAEDQIPTVQALASVLYSLPIYVCTKFSVSIKEDNQWSNTIQSTSLSFA